MVVGGDAFGRLRRRVLVITIHEVRLVRGCVLRVGSGPIYTVVVEVNAGVHDPRAVHSWWWRREAKTTCVRASHGCRLMLPDSMATAAQLDGLGLVGF